MSFRIKKADLFHSGVEPKDYDMVEFFIKRLKLWTGITKAKEVSSTAKSFISDSFMLPMLINAFPF